MEIYRCRISALNGHQICHSERLSIRNHRGNCSKFKMQPIICKKQSITLMTLTPPITSSMYPTQRIEKSANTLSIQIYRIDRAVCVCCPNDWFLFWFIARSSDEVLHIISNILEALQRARTSLVIPKKKPIDELMKSRNMVSQNHKFLLKWTFNWNSNHLSFRFSCLAIQKSLVPNLPDDLAISFYLQSHKLIFAVYQLTSVQGAMKFDSFQAECSVPWVNEVLVFLTVALQLCQQLKDKVGYRFRRYFWMRLCNLSISCY